MTPTELAWAAGFFDGEGHSTVLHKQLKSGPAEYIQLGVSQLDTRPLLRFGLAVGEGNITRPGGTSPCWNWRVTGTKAQTVMNLLWPYLSEPKREQFLRNGGDAPE